MKKNGDVSLIQTFADKLDLIGDEDNVEEFKRVSTQLSSAVSSFDIGECLFLLNRFGV